VTRSFPFPDETALRVALPMVELFPVPVDPTQITQLESCFTRNLVTLKETVGSGNLTFSATNISSSNKDAIFEATILADSMSMFEILEVGFLCRIGASVRLKI